MSPRAARAATEPRVGFVLALCAAAWVVRFLFLATTPSYLSGDEIDARASASIQHVEDFLLSTNPAERWTRAENLAHGPRLVWLLGFNVWGAVLRGPPETAWLFALLAAAVGTLALAGTAGAMFGRRAAAFALAFASLSPMALNYSIRTIGAVFAFAWICLALRLLARPGWRPSSWIGGGACMGIAFAWHYGSGVAILAIGAGLAASAAARPFRAGTPGDRASQTLLHPVAGALAALAPPAALEAWARVAGVSYFALLTSHGNLALDEHGPPGHWLRVLWELDPAIEILVAAFATRAVLAGGMSPVARIGAVLAALACFAVVAFALPEALVRARVSVAACAVVGIAFGAALARGARKGATAAADDDDEPPLACAPAGESVPAPFGTLALGVSVVAAFAIFTAVRAFGEMPRQTFPAWPLFALAIAGFASRALAADFPRVFRVHLAVAAPAFALGAWALFGARTLPVRRSLFEERNRDLIRLDYIQFADESHYETLARRANDEIRVFAPPLAAYPSNQYEEEVFKDKAIRELLARRGVADLFARPTLVNASAHFAPADPTGETIPPPGTPLAPPAFAVEDESGRAIRARVHPERGVEIRFPRGRLAEPSRRVASLRPEPAAAGATNATEGDPVETVVAGLELAVVAPNAPPGAEVFVRARLGETELFAGALSLEPARGGFRTVHATGPRGDGAIVVEATLTPPAPEAGAPRAYVPPIAVYARRAFVRAAGD